MLSGIIILLLITPALGYILQILGVRRERDAELTLTQPISAAVLDTHIAYFAKLHQWALLHKEETAEKVIYLFQVGKWGVKLQGVQEVNATLFFENGTSKVFIKSKSLMGQFIDFGVNQKNVNELSLFLADLSNDPNGTSPRAKAIFPLKTSVIDYKYWGLILGITCIWFLWTATGALIPKHYVSGRIRVIFQKRVPTDILETILQANGAIRCNAIIDEEFPTYECDVPVGDEELVAGQVSRNSAVREAAPILRE